MSRTVLEDAFAHHVWASLRVIDACRSLSPEQLEASAPGTMGSILATLRHIVGADCSYLALLIEDRSREVDEDSMDLPALRAAMEANGPTWQALTARPDLDPDRVVVRHRDDGSASHAPLGVRLSQVVHHGTDHRSQICTILTTLGIEPPEIDVWDWARDRGRLKDVPAPG
jgi:uncharacterized damage-inducible protein DinB